MDIVVRESVSPVEEDNPLRYVLSDESVDSYGDVVSVNGWVLSEFRSNPIALFNHDRNAIVGVWEKVAVEGKRLVGQLRLAAKGSSPLTDYIRALVEQGILRATSVGFVPLDSEPLANTGVRFTRQKLKEVSLVSIPANANAVQLARSFGIRPEDNPVFQDPASSQGIVQRNLEATHGKLAKRNPDTGIQNMSKLAKRIENAQQSIVSLRDHLILLTDKDERTDQEEIEFEEIPGRIEAAKKELANLQAAERALAVREADPAVEEEEQQQQRQQEQRLEQRQLPAVQRPFSIPRKKIEPRDYLVKLAAIHFLAKVKQQPFEQAMARLAANGGVGYNDDAMPMILRAVVSPATTTTAGWAAELIQTAVADLMMSLMPVSIYPKLAALGTTHSFDRNGGAIRIPARSSTANISGAWVGEGQPIPVRKLSLTSIPLVPKKLAVISTFTAEIAAYSTPALEGVIRESMADDTAVTIDTTLVDAVAISTIRPAGLRNGVSGLTPSALTTPAAAMVADLKALISAITNVNGGRNLAILMNPAQAMGLSFAQTTTGDFMFSGTDEAGRRFSVTFIISTTMPAGTVICVDAGDFTSAIGAPEYNVSEQATVHEEDTAPLPLSSTGTPNVVAAPVRSLWQTDSIGIRMIWPANWAMRRTGMVSWMSSVLW